MADETNFAMMDYSDDAILPDDFDPNDPTYTLDRGMTDTAPTGETTPTTEEVAESNVAEQSMDASTTEQSDQPAPTTVKIKYNHEDRELTLDEAAILAQKGLNYDKIEQRMRALEAYEARSARLAQSLGYQSSDEMIAAAEQNHINRQIRELVDAGNTEAMARFLVEQKMAKANQSFAAQAPTPQVLPTPAASSATSGLTPERQAELAEFVNRFPGVTKLPDEVIADNRRGVRLSDAYERYQSKLANSEQTKLRQELAVLKQNQAAAAKAPVSGTVGKAAPAKEEPEEPFMKGFNTAY